MSTQHDFDLDQLAKAHEETSKKIQHTLFILVLFSLFCIFTLLGTPDIELLSGKGSQISLPIPFGNFRVSFNGFMLFGPLVLFGITVYLHSFLQHWRALSKLPELPAIRRTPFLFNLPYPSSKVASHLLFYWLTPTVLYYFVWKALPFTHDIDFFIPLLFFCISASWSLCLQLKRNWKHFWVRNIIISALLISVVGLPFVQFFGILTKDFALISRHFQLSRENLSGQFLSNMDLRGAFFSQANLSQAHLKGANLEGANFWRANLSQADLSDTILEGAILEEANLKDAILSDANLAGTRMEGSDFTKAKLVDTDLSCAQASKAVFRQADLSNAKLTGANLAGADLDRANLTGTNLTGVNLSEVENLTQDQLNKACADFLPVKGLPVGLSKPPWCFFGADYKPTYPLTIEDIWQIIPEKPPCLKRPKTGAVSDAELIPGKGESELKLQHNKAN